MWNDIGEIKNTAKLRITKHSMEKKKKLLFHSGKRRKRQKNSARDYSAEGNCFVAEKSIKRTIEEILQNCFIICTVVMKGMLL
jgi:hypothetical protein